MKRLISILLFIITALYVLPVSSGLKTDMKLSGKYVDNKCDDSKDDKKESGKEFISTDFVIPAFKNTAVKLQPQIAVFIPPVHATLELPPPNKA